MMKKFLALIFASVLFASCKSSDKPAMKLYGWFGMNASQSEEQICDYFTKYRSHGMEGVLVSVGTDTAAIAKVAHAAKTAGMSEYHAWIPTMIQRNEQLDSSCYAINRKGFSAIDKPAYAPYYTFLCPSNPTVIDYMVSLYGSVAEIKDVDYVHLDYIRFPDVILARALWDKYGLVMNEEYDEADYCYCKRCVEGFKKASGIDILSYDDPSTCEEWKEYRYDQITSLVDKIADAVHAKGKKLSAAVFPGPTIGKKLVRQDIADWKKVDAFFPMNYNDFYLGDVAWIGEQVREEVEAVGDKPVYSGLFICPQPERKAEIKDPEGHGLLPEEICEAVKVSLDGGAKGVCLFTPDRMTPEHWAALDSCMNK